MAGDGARTRPPEAGPPAITVRSDSETDDKAAANNTSNGAKKLVRGYCDGCYDGFHSGHSNALRQAKQHCDVLVVGVHSNEEIRARKGPPLFTDEERLAMVKACKYADEVAFGTPYNPTLELLDELGCDVVLHGDDTSEGDCFQEVRDAGRLRVFKRTEGVSTTDLCGRLLAASGAAEAEDAGAASMAGESSFLATSRRIAEFSNRAGPAPGQKVVYVHGSFDLLHAGHIDLLEHAASLGFVYVGVHSDAAVRERKGGNFPLMCSMERALGLLAVRHVGDVVFDAPEIITREMLTTLNVDIVLHAGGDKGAARRELAVPREMGILQVMPRKRDLSIETLLERVRRGSKKYLDRQADRGAKELEYLRDRQFVEEA